MEYQIVWDGPVFANTGIGTASREYAIALHSKGIDVKVVAGRNGSSRRLNGKLTALAVKPFAKNKTRILVYHRLPHTLNFANARKHFDFLILNTVWETTRIPRNWFPYINMFDAICVPSAQNKTALKNSGVKKPIFIVPHGVNTHSFHPGNKKITLPFPQGTFVFVSVFTFQHRKNPETLLRAYWEEFSIKDRAALVIKTSGFSESENEQWIRTRILAYKNKLRLRKKTAPVRLIGGYMHPSRLKGIYTAGNVFVLPTRGEGVGLPFMESLSSGVPVIATAWGGHMDFLHQGNSFPVSYRMRPPIQSMKRAISRKFEPLFAQKGQLWAEADLQSLKRQMRNAYANPALCRIKGRQGRKDMQKHSWDRAASIMKLVIEKVIRTNKSKM